MTPSASSITTAEPLSVTLSVSGASNAPAPTGSVTLISGNYTSAPTSLVSGNASISIFAGALPAGSDTITAAYSGDANYVTASFTVPVTVTAIPPSFALAATNIKITSPGSTANNTSTITITPAGGFTGAVTLTASLASSPTSAVDPPTFSFGSSSPVVVTGTSPATATLTITTTPAAKASLRDPRLFPTAGGGAILSCVVIFMLQTRRRKWLTALALTSFLAFVTGALSGCSNAPSNHNSGTTPGSYVITVTGTSGTLTSTSQVTLTVQ